MNQSDNLPSHHGTDSAPKKTYPNETIKLLLERGSLRNFTDKKIPPDIMQTVLEAGIHAPTGGNLQPYSIIKIENKSTAALLAKLCGEQNFIAEASVNLLFCIDYHRLQRWAEIETAPFTATASFRHFWIGFQDTIIAAQNICTAADALGLGSVYIGTVTECFRELIDIFDLPQGVFPVVLLTLGYPKAKPPVKKKLGVPIVVHDEKYHELDDVALRKAFDDKYPGLKVQITPERLDTIAEVCRKVHGEVFAQKCIETIEKNGFINAVQRYFGLHYRADEMPCGNDEFMKIMEESGCNWFKKFEYI
ncbi:MAG: nitroreductase family protein [candidate division Zixibacteria bacterium]|nr:nitroreductase family protein [candidate division Zixibacteria bacterium]